ncbi:uncharacterized protein LOC143429926 [Xylocopa sonorina]|uniref:uncharacterized protein LOC143429926 n=1 Tax=Xylocopa sonorina TaxID=1818115 RepID=UPI00403ADD2B
MHSADSTRRNNMMKFVLAVVAVLALSSPMQAYNIPRTGNGALAKELQDFVDAIPLDKMVSILLEYVAEDKEVQQVLEYLQSEDFKGLVSDVEAMPEVIELLNYIQSAGVDAYYLVNKANAFLGLKELKPPAHLATYKISGGVRGLINDLKAVFPLDKVEALYKQKMANSQVFRDFMAHLSSPAFQHIAAQVCANPHFNSLLATAKKAGIDVVAVKQIIETILGVPLNCKFFQMKLQAAAFTALVALATVSCHNLPNFGQGPLHEDIQYFLDFIPFDKVVSIVLQYASEDTEFHQLLEYFETNEFKTMVQEIEAIPQFHDFTAYLEKNGVHIDSELNKLNKVIGIPPFQRYNAGPRITGGLKGLFEDVKSLVNYDDFIHGYVYKMRTSPPFREFVAHLKSEGNQKFINALYQNKNYLHFRSMLVSKQLDIALIEDIIYTVLGIEFPVVENSYAAYADNELSRDIHEFTDLIDMNKIVSIVMSYLDDDEVKKAMEYMYSEEFHALVRKVEALPEYRDLVRYLADAGLNIYGLIQKVHKLFGMEDYVPPKLSLTHTIANRGGVKGLVDDVIAVLPLDKFKALFQQKMQNSPAFRAFVQKLRSDDFQKIVNAIYQAPIFLEMRQKAIDVGLNLAPVRKVIEDMLGIHLPTPTMH